MPPNSPTQPPPVGVLDANSIAKIRAAAGAPPLSSTVGTAPKSLSISLFGDAPDSATATHAGGGLEDTLFPAETPKPLTFGERVKEDFNKRVDTGSNAIVDAEQGKQSPVSAGLQVFGEGAGAVTDIAGDALKSVDQTFTGGKIGDLLTSLIKGSAGKPSITGEEIHTEQAQKAQQQMKDWTDAHPEAAKNLEAVFNIAGIIPGVGGAGKAVEGAADAAKAGKAIVEGGVSAVKGAGEVVAKKADAVVDSARLAATKGNQIPTLENAAQKGIPIPGDTTIKDPLARYDEHVAAEQKALKDAKADTALGGVGGKIGDAFEQVAKTRREAGETMASELEKVGAHSTDTRSAGDAFRAELSKNGLSYDQVTKDVTRGKASKVTESDQSLLQDYAKSLQALGSKPTVQELDAFLSRTPDELNVYKAKNNITGTTNGERIIKNNLTQLRKELDPMLDEKTGKAAKPYLKDYSAARKQYADLSKFLEEGQSFLGKKTQAGDYAKDASLAKSAVQSILNNGKKDWLLKLEALTGYPAIDDATLALQAMKDTGDYRGASLLESITEGAVNGKAPEVPTSGTGMINYALGKLLKGGAQKFVGTPAEQTRRYLQSIKKGSGK